MKPIKLFVLSAFLFLKPLPSVALEIQKYIQDKQIIFIGESHNRSPKPILETNIFEQIASLKRPVMILTEFIWPSWQRNLDLFMEDNSSNDKDLLRNFIKINVAPTRFDASAFSERISAFILWSKKNKIPLIGIDLDNFGANSKYQKTWPEIPASLLKKVATQFNLQDYMIDTVSLRDLNMAERTLEIYNKYPPNTLFVVYTGSTHTEKIPTLLYKKIPQDKMLSLHLGDYSPASFKIAASIKATVFSPQTHYLYKFDDLNQTIRYAQAAQTLIYEGSLWGEM